MLYIGGVELLALGRFISCAIRKLQTSIADVCANIFVFKISSDNYEGVCGWEVVDRGGLLYDQGAIVFWEELANKQCVNWWKCGILLARCFTNTK